MGRFLKNKELTSASYSIRAPYGYSAVGPNYPVDGLLRFNQTVGAFEGYLNNNWRQFSFAGAASIDKDAFTGDGLTQAFTMTRTYSATPGNTDYLQLLVFVGNVFQNPGVAYTVLSDVITFTAPPNDQQPIVVLHGFAG